MSGYLVMNHCMATRAYHCLGVTVRDETEFGTWNSFQDKGVAYDLDITAKVDSVCSEYD